MFFVLFFTKMFFFSFWQMFIKEMPTMYSLISFSKSLK